jgi:hypothetical protein
LAIVFTKAHSPAVGQTFAYNTGLAGGGVTEVMPELANAKRSVSNFMAYTTSRDIRKPEILFDESKEEL